MKLKSFIAGLTFLTMSLPLAVHAQEVNSDFLFQVESPSEPLIVQVSVPVSISAKMNLAGDITVEGSAKIENLEADKSIKLESINVSGYDGWNIVDFSTDFSNYDLNSKYLGMMFGEYATKDGGTVDVPDDSALISPGGVLDLPIKVNMPKQDQNSGLIDPKSIAKITYEFTSILASEFEASTASTAGANSESSVELNTEV